MNDNTMTAEVICKICRQRHPVSGESLVPYPQAAAEGASYAIPSLRVECSERPGQFAEYDVLRDLLQPESTGEKNTVEIVRDGGSMSIRVRRLNGMPDIGIFAAKNVKDSALIAFIPRLVVELKQIECQDTDVRSFVDAMVKGGDFKLAFETVFATPFNKI